MQKIAPIFLISYIAIKSRIIFLLRSCGILSALFGAIGGINQISLRKVIAFSSINHLGWLIRANIIREQIMLLYFLFYCIISLSVVIIFSLHQYYYFYHLFNKNNFSSKIKLLICICLLSLGGLPPFTGFLPK